MVHREEGKKELELDVLKPITYSNVGDDPVEAELLDTTSTPFSDGRMQRLVGFQRLRMTRCQDVRMCCNDPQVSGMEQRSGPTPTCRFACVGIGLSYYC